MMDHNFFCTFAMLQSEKALTAVSPILKFGQTPYVSHTIIINLTDILLPFAVCRLNGIKEEVAVCVWPFWPPQEK